MLYNPDKKKVDSSRRTSIRGVSNAVWKRTVAVTPTAMTFGLAGLIGVSTSVPAQEDVAHGLPPAQSTSRALESSERGGKLLPGFYPGISIIATRHSNARRTTANDGSDTVLSLAHDLTYRTNFAGNHVASVTYAGTANRYADFDTEDTTSHELSGQVQLDLGRRVDVDLNAGYSQGSEARGSSAARSGLDIDPEPDEFDETRFGAEARYGRRENALQVGVGFETRGLEYTNNDQGGRDRDTDKVYGRVYYNISPKTSLLAEVGRAEVDYKDVTNTLDSTEDTIAIGARWQPTDITGFELKVGNTQKSFDDASRPDFDGATYLGRMTWKPTRATSVAVYASRAVEESSDSAASFFVSDLVGITVNHGLTERLNLLGYINQTDDDYSNGRKDDVIDYGVGLDFAMREWLSLNARVGKISRDSNAPETAFDDTFVSIGLSARRQ